MVPKSKRAKRRNRRHGSSGYVLYGWFRFLETEEYWNDISTKNGSWYPIRTVMIGGVVKHG